MKKSNWILLIVTFSIFIIVNAPASLLSSFIYHVSHGKVELANTEGTVWKGVGNPVLHEKNGRLISLNALRWNIEMIELLIGHLKSDFYWDVENSSLPMNVTISVAVVPMARLPESMYR